MSDDTSMNVKLQKPARQCQEKKTNKGKNKTTELTPINSAEDVKIKKARTRSSSHSVVQCTCSISKLSLSSESEKELKSIRTQSQMRTNTKRKTQQQNGYFGEKVKLKPEKNVKDIKGKERSKNNVNRVTCGKDTVNKKVIKNGSTESSDSEKEEERKKTKKNSKKILKQEKKFPDVIPPAKMLEILKSQEHTNLTQKYVQGYFRVNPKFRKHGYISMRNGEYDLLIIGAHDRNSAFDGDLVVASINEEEKWHDISDGQKQKTGTIICILEEIHPRRAIGYLKEVDKTIFLYPRDLRVPIIRIYRDSLPAMYNNMPSLFEKVLFFAKITQWKFPKLAVGRIERMVGTAGDIEAEINAVILENSINTTLYHNDLVKGLPSSDYVLTPADMKDREDWRDACVFTIDPSTAVDLDDALSCKVLDNENFEVGVHIADVTHFLKFNSPLDAVAAKRATTVYMANEVYHMLPKSLCILCSLLPGEDKLAFSVIFEMTPDARVVKHRFTKTIINSCCQMSYEHAQKMIENPENLSSDLLKISGNYTVAQLSEAVNNLFKLSDHLRRRRFADGALQINQPKLRVIIDKESGLPISYSIEEQKDSNRLIEEFMLLANMTVAKHLYNTIPEYALLRNHRLPSERLLTVTRDMLQRFGIHLNIESSKDLQSSMKRYEPQPESQSEEFLCVTKYTMMVINSLCSKAMARATYRCSSNIAELDDLRHYALNVPFYTHFTSPIRRYPDCIVHRLLNATIRKAKLPKTWTSELCTKIAKYCNLRKNYAKLAEEQSNELYFTYLIGIKGPMTVVGIALDVKEHGIDVILCEIGIKLRINTSELKEKAIIKYSVEWSIPTLTITWKASNITQVITTFSILHLKIEKNMELFRLDGELLEPQLQS